MPIFQAIKKFSISHLNPSTNDEEKGKTIKENIKKSTHLIPPIKVVVYMNYPVPQKKKKIVY